MMLIALIIDSIGPNQVSFASSGGNLDQSPACSQSLMQIIEGSSKKLSRLKDDASRPPRRVCLQLPDNLVVGARLYQTNE